MSKKTLVLVFGFSSKKSLSWLSEKGRKKKENLSFCSFFFFQGLTAEDLNDPELLAMLGEAGWGDDELLLSEFDEPQVEEGIPRFPPEKTT